MFEKIKTFVVEHKLDVIEKGAAVLGGIVGIVVVAVSMSIRNNENEPFEDSDEEYYDIDE
jgi:hypothetical protein